MVRNVKYPCGICHENVTKNAIVCNECNVRHHIKCSGISASEYEAFSNEPDDVPWFCLKCTINHHGSIFPFGSIENETLLNLFDFDKPSFVDTLPSFDDTTRLTNLPNLQDYDIDEQLPSNIDSSYHTIQDFSTFDNSPTDLSLLHINLRNLSSHFYELHSLDLSALTLLFLVIHFSLKKLKV